MSNAPRSAAARRNWGDDDSGTPILHLDMDAFFASVEELDYPHLRGRPLAVGGRERGVISAANYQARAYGVRSAMPTHLALAACPQLVLQPGRFSRYREVSAAVMALLAEVTYRVEQVSVDEAYLDVSGARRTGGSPVEIGAHLRQRIRERVGVPASVGVGSTKLIAKLASAHAKPDGLLLIPAQRSLEFLHSLPVGAIPGVGAVTQRKLSARELHTVGDLADLLLTGLLPGARHAAGAPAARHGGSVVPAAGHAAGAPAARHGGSVVPVTALPLLPGGRELERLVGRSAAESLARMVFNDDRRQVRPERQEKSLGKERTFATNLRTKAELAQHVRKFAYHCAASLRTANQRASVVAIKVRDGQFRTVTRSRSLDRPSNAVGQITDAALALLETLPMPPTGVRLLGVRVEGLVGQESGYQAAFDDDPRDSASAHGVDEVRRRFGTDALLPAALLPTALPGKQERPPGGGATTP
ncbi:Y-family DNA polymerase [Buchananella felis]|uniref:Y-family DNA polymerase n=1 Tax=Buchananella felis TaxID=3231492 RepID=UPI00352724A0